LNSLPFQAPGRSTFSKIGSRSISLEDRDLKKLFRRARPTHFRKIGADEETRFALGIDAERMKSVRAMR
jgi:hypothetical protein